MSNSSSKTPLILTVDDEEDIISLVKEMLELNNRYRAISAKSAAEALEVLEKHKDEKPDLILLDIMMEPIDGWKTLQMIKEREEFKDIPVIMLTAKPLTAETVKNKQRAESIEGYIVKPIRYHELTSKIDEVLNQEEKIRRKVEEFLSKGKEKEAKEYERYAKAIERHKKLMQTLLTCAKLAGIAETDRVKNVVKMQQNLIKISEERLKRLEKYLS